MQYRYLFLADDVSHSKKMNHSGDVRDRTAIGTTDTADTTDTYNIGEQTRVLAPGTDAFQLSTNRLIHAIQTVMHDVRTREQIQPVHVG